MRVTTSTIRLLLATVVTIGAAGCATSQDQQQPIVPTPLAFDPTHTYDVAEWWTDGTQLLRLEESGAYAVYPGMNRYEPPVERGRWLHPAFDHLILEKYNTRPTEPRRVGITRIDGRLTLLMPNREPMRPLTNPPRVTEDALFGTWSGPDGLLTLERSMRYIFQPPDRAGNDQPRSAIGHRGTWQLVDGVIVLRPLATRIEPKRFTVEREDDTVRMTGPDGALAKQ